jgi:ribosomal-protein-alanine N-acetyltransferase
VATAGSPPILETPRLRLRPLTIDDAPWYLAHFSRPEIVHGSGFPAPPDLAAARGELRRFVLDLIAAGTGMRWGIAEQGRAELVGSIGYYRLVDGPPRQAEIGYDLVPERWGRGIMTEALGAMVSYCTGVLGVERLEALVLLDNERSARLLERAGFRREGVLREHGTNELGEPCDEISFVRTVGASER